MKDRLGEFIERHRTEFESGLPSEAVWGKIQHSIRRSSPKRLISILKRVAAAVLIFISAFSLSDYMHNRKNHSAESTEPIKLPTEIQEAEVFYTSLVHAKTKEAEPWFIQYPELKAELDADFMALDSLSISLKNDLKDNASNLQVLEALIENYRVRLEILETMLQEFQDVKNEDDDPFEI